MEAVVAALLTIAALAGALVWTAPRWLVPAVGAASPGCLYAVDTPERLIALTIDDGPDTRGTPEILEVLARHDARATFFLISDRARAHPELVTAIARAGHEIGNHLTRDEPSVRLSRSEFEAALVEADSVLSAHGPLRWARPGGGWYSPTMLATMRHHGYRCALGSVYPLDPLLRSAAFSRAYIARHARPGAVIVLHDGGARGPRTAAALRRVLPELTRRGYRVVSLSELTTVVANLVL